MDAKVKKILKATKQENMNQAVDFAGSQRARVNHSLQTEKYVNGKINSRGEAGQFGGFLKKDK